jgi:hypothetical protein
MQKSAGHASRYPRYTAWHHAGLDCASAMRSVHQTITRLHVVSQQLAGCPLKARVSRFLPILFADALTMRAVAAASRDLAC